MTVCVGSLITCGLLCRACKDTSLVRAQHLVTHQTHIILTVQVCTFLAAAGCICSPEVSIKSLELLCDSIISQSSLKYAIGADEALTNSNRLLLISKHAMLSVICCTHDVLVCFTSVRFRVVTASRHHVSSQRTLHLYPDQDKPCLNLLAALS